MSSKIIISIEGNIGAGKSSLMKLLKSKLSRDVEFIDEPVDEWIQMKNNQGENLLEVFYKNQPRWAYSFQNIAYITRMKRVIEAIQNSKKDFIIMDRSPDGDKNTFTKMLIEDGCIDKLEEEAYNKWCDLFKTYFCNNVTFHYIYLQCNPNTAYKRIQKRGREEENKIPKEYINRLHKAHEDWLLDNNEVTKICVDQDFVNDENRSYKIFSNIYELMIKLKLGK